MGTRYFVITSNRRFVYGQNLVNLCQKLTNLGLNLPDIKYEVWGYDSETVDFVMWYDPKRDVWTRHVPAHDEDIMHTKQMKAQKPPVIEGGK